jgi:hypothetical protein
MGRGHAALWFEICLRCTLFETVLRTPVTTHSRGEFFNPARRDKRIKSTKHASPRNLPVEHCNQAPHLNRAPEFLQSSKDHLFAVSPAWKQMFTPFSKDELLVFHYQSINQPPQYLCSGQMFLRAEGVQLLDGGFIQWRAHDYFSFFRHCWINPGSCCASRDSNWQSIMPAVAPYDWYAVTVSGVRRSHTVR